MLDDMMSAVVVPMMHGFVRGLRKGGFRAK
jgi:hypothetical protein